MKYKLSFLLILGFVGLLYGVSDPQCPSGKSESLTQFANSLSKTDLDSVRKISIEFQKAAKEQTRECRESLFSIFHKFHSDFVNAKSQAMGALGEWTKEKRAELAQVGIAVSDHEGFATLEEDPNWSKTQFGTLIPEVWVEYLTLKKREMDEKAVKSWDEVVQKIAAWESFLKKHQHFPEKEEVTGFLGAHIQDLLTGTETNSLYHESAEGSGKLKDDAKKTYEKFIQTQKNSKYFTLVKGFYDKLRANGFKWTKNLEVYLNSHGIRTVPGMMGGP